MTYAELAFACVLHLVHGGTSEGKCDRPFFREVADAAQVESKRFKFPVDTIVGVIRVESSFDPDAKSPKGALGLMQVLRNGAADGDFAKMSDWMLTRVQLNVFLGVRYLAWVRRGCREFFLTTYNQGHGCFDTSYNSGVYEAIRSMKASRTFQAMRRRPPRAPENGTPGPERSWLALQPPAAALPRYSP